MLENSKLKDNIKDYLVLTVRTQNGKELNRFWSIVSSPKNPLGEGFSQLMSPPISNKIIESYSIEEIINLKAELHQQRFNNLHNLSIDQTIANKIKELEDQVQDYKRSYELEKRLFDIEKAKLQEEVNRYYQYHKEFWNK